MTDLARLRKLVTTNDSTSDAELLDRFVTARDESAFAALVHRHGPMVLGTCRRVLRHRQDAEDAFQATFLVLARRAGVITPRSLVGNWLYGVACRTASAARRMSSARQTREARAAAQRTEEVTHDDARLAPELRDALDRELAALPAVYRAAVVACDLEGLSRRDAAGQLGWTEGTLSSRLARGRSLLARRLSRYGLVVPVAGLVAPATVAAELVAPTIQLGVLIPSGEAVVAAPVAALMEGMMKSMSLTKLKTIIVTAVVAIAVAAVGTAGWRSNAVVAAPPKEPDAPVASNPKPVVRSPDQERMTELERERERLQHQRDAMDAERAARQNHESRASVEMNRRGAALATAPDVLPAPNPQPVQNPDKERIVALERECYELRQQITVLRAESQTLSKYIERMEVERQKQLQRAADARAAAPVVRVYPVGDLAGDEKQGASLVKVVRAAVEPRSWDGDASIEFLPVKQLLVVRQSIKGHEEVAELLKLLSSQHEPKRLAPAPAGGR
ncbi:sigma-70 family RNA polymerase sigma factor [Gemmata sp. JC673]|uniref:Sigma-70 family RNA polymerase sigma factor n=1 Tax=Gemmata algarum TaxID=2975278 RepID=A0ABU5F701_9BACT|nr:sigma-70 family RNA polymerase sigma factor [Gemmata algarum]MDY3563259.1 sigma-70 family RNA polymerase sigma factor [Gemmata algarum]